MNNTDHLSLLVENIEGLKESEKWFRRSYDICNDCSLPPKDEQEMDAFESFTSRYARVSDMLFNKVFRSIYYLENAETASLLDVTLFMEKIGVVDDAKNARKIKELRNDIVHDYAFDNLNDIFGEVLKMAPELLTYIGNAVKYTDILKEKFQR